MEEMEVLEVSYEVRNKKHFADLNNMRLAGQLCDVTIKVNGKEFQAHKIVLAANLKYFQSMFLNDGFRENIQNVVTMQNLEEKYLELILSYAYTGEYLLSKHNALGLLEVANYLNEDTIKNDCINFLENHLEKSEACQAYQFANAIECVPLKTIARSRILSNFEYCSQTADYFDFDCDTLKNILCDINLYPQSQQSCFEGLIRWILHDVENRKTYVKDLLNLIDMSKLAPDYVIKYFCSITKDQSDIAAEIMTIYHDRTVQKSTNLNQGLKNQANDSHEEMRSNGSVVMLVGTADKKLKMQFYDFTERKWSQPREITHLNQFEIDQCIVFRNQLYYTIYDRSVENVTHLQVFDLATKQISMLTSEKSLLTSSALCASTEMIYFCGGRIVGGDDGSDQVLKYDPRTNHFETLPPMRIKRACSAAVFYQGYILVLGGHDEQYRMHNSVEKYDPVTNSWLDFPSMKDTRDYFAVALLNGKLYACGGNFNNTVEVYDPSINSWSVITSISRVTIFPPLIVAHEDKLLCIVNDRKKSGRVYDPRNRRWLLDREMSKGIQLNILGGGLVSSIYVN